MTTMTMMMTLSSFGSCGGAEDMRDAFEVSSISSNSDQNTALNSETIHCWRIIKQIQRNTHRQSTKGKWHLEYFDGWPENHYEGRPKYGSATYRFRHRTLSEIIIVTWAIYHGRDSSTFLTCPIFDFGGISSNSSQLEQRTMACLQRDEFLMIPTLVSNITLPDKQL